MNTGQQLQMVWSERLLDKPPDIRVPPGYVVRTNRAGDESEFFRLMELVGFRNWDAGRLSLWLARVLPHGWFVAVHRATGAMAATAMASHNPIPLHPFAAEMGWVAGHPHHAGQGLGTAVCAAATARMLQAGYERIYLKTDDHRLPALKTYLKLGYVPYLFAPDMPSRWRAICEKLGWPYTPANWPKEEGVEP